MVYLQAPANGTPNRYALALEWTPGDRASLDKALADVGLELARATRKVPTMVVEPKEEG